MKRNYDMFGNINAMIVEFAAIVYVEKYTFESLS